MGKAITKHELGVTLGKLQRFLLGEMAILKGSENPQTKSLYSKMQIEVELTNDILLALQGDKVGLNVRYWIR